MARNPPQAITQSCVNCGYRAPAGSDDWDRADHPSLGSLTRCPECGSTNVINRG